MEIQSRRYTGSKYKLLEWIKALLKDNCPECHSFFDVFGGTGVVTASVLNDYDSFIINDLLFSNEIIYKAFFCNDPYDKAKLEVTAKEYNTIDRKKLSENYVSENFGDKYFRKDDAKLIGFIREDIKSKLRSGDINKMEYCILLASLLYSFDRSANTVGHYEAFIKGKEIKGELRFELIDPISTFKQVDIYRKDANELVKEVSADIAFIDPPYNSRQYSRFYHVLETITKWNKPKLAGVAMKPPEENMSDYCRNKAPEIFEDLVNNLNAKYIVVTYNNTYDSKSSSSRNKISLDEIKDALERRGNTKVFEKKHQCFNAGKTDFKDHKEFLFITEVEKEYA